MLTPLIQLAQQCNPGMGIGFGLPTWYEGLPCNEHGVPDPSGLNDIWIIGANILDMLLFIASVATVFFIIYGGIKFITSQGSPDKIAQAKQTLIYAAVGLVTSIVARVIVQFVAQQLFGTSDVNIDA